MLGEKIKSLRKNKKITQAELGKAVGLSQSSVGMVESNRTGLSLQKAQAIADFFQINLSDLLDANELMYSISNSELINERANILYHTSNDFFRIPSHFDIPSDARNYLKNHEIFGSNGLNIDTLSDEEVLEFANELLNQMELISYKYKK